MRYLALFPLLALPVLAACGPSEQKLQTRAAYDFNCPGPQLQLVKLDQRTRGVQGCGQRATYVWVCSGNDCTWVLNSDSRPQGR